MIERPYVLFGQTGLTLGVARTLRALDHLVVVMHKEEPDSDFLELLPPEINVRRLSPRSSEFEAALKDCHCFLTLEDDDQDNLRLAVRAHLVAPEVPVVMRTFDPRVAEVLQEGVNVRRAYSLSALAAPAFVGAFLAEELLAALTLSGSYVVVSRLTVESGSPLVGLHSDEMERRYEVQRLSGARGIIEPGTILELAGVQDKVLGVAAVNHPPPRQGGPAPRSRKSLSSSPDDLLGAAVKALLLILLLAVVVYWRYLDLDFVSALYFVVTTATTVGYGDINLALAPPWLKLFGCLVMISGGGLVAVLFSRLTSWVSRDRQEEMVERMACRLQNHVVLAGMGRVGYRIEQLLELLRIPCVVIDLQGNRFTGATRRRGLVIQGDARLPEDLGRTGIARARAFVAASSDDLFNLQFCLQARRLNPKVYTVARIGNPELAQSLSTAFGINAVVDPVATAVGAFVGAATDERALRRFSVEGRPFLGFRHWFEAEVSARQLAEWRQQGLFVVAAEVEDKARRVGADSGVVAQSWAAVVGEESVTRRVLLDSV